METYNDVPSLTALSHELLCHIFQYLSLREILSVSMLCRKLNVAANMHFKLCKMIDFCPDSVDDYMPSSITDENLLVLFKKCPQLEIVYGLHPQKVERRKLRKRSSLTVPGIIDALHACKKLKAIETCDLRLLESVLLNLHHIEIIGHFQNRDYMFPPHASQKLKLQPYPQISSLHLIGVEVPELTTMPHLKHLHLQCVRFTKLQPFRAFLAQDLRSFVMKNCIGPAMSLRYLSLIIALSSALNLNHLELVRVPLPGSLLQRTVDDAHGHGNRGFTNLRTLVISGCKGVLEVDLGHLMIVASQKLETLYIQPSLTKDSLFVSLSYAQCTFPSLHNLHLGYIDCLNYPGEWSNDALLSMGLAEVPDTPSSITDSGMKVIGQLLPNVKSLSVSNCPHLMTMYHWMPGPNGSGWSSLTDLTLQKCHCLQLSSFTVFVSLLQNIQVIILYEMFKEPPKGCSHVGLSAGTGLGMSSAVVSNQDEHLAVQGHPVQDFDNPMEDEIEEAERELMEQENEDNQEPHFMVLRGDFFEEDDDIDYVEYENRCINEALRRQREGYFSDDSSESWFGDDEHDTDGGHSSQATNQPGAVQNAPSRSEQGPFKSTGTQSNNKPDEKSDIDPNNRENSCHSPSVKSSDPTYVYDPHQPSTSKAGRHLDIKTNPVKTYTIYCRNPCCMTCKDNFQNFVCTSSRNGLNCSEIPNNNDGTVNSFKAENASKQFDNVQDVTADNIQASSLNKGIQTDEQNELSTSVDNQNMVTKPCVVLVSKIEDNLSSKVDDPKSVMNDDCESIKKENEPSRKKSYLSLNRNKTKKDSAPSTSPRDTSTADRTNGIVHCERDFCTASGSGQSNKNDFQPCCIKKIKRESNKKSRNPFTGGKHNTLALDELKSPKNISSAKKSDDKCESISDKNKCTSLDGHQTLHSNSLPGSENYEVTNNKNKKLKFKNQYRDVISSEVSQRSKLPSRVSRKEVDKLYQEKTVLQRSQNGKNHHCKKSTSSFQEMKPSSVEERMAVENIKESNEITPCHTITNNIKDEVSSSTHSSTCKVKQEIKIESTNQNFKLSASEIKPKSEGIYNTHSMSSSKSRQSDALKQPFFDCYDPSRPSTSGAAFNYDTNQHLPKKRRCLQPSRLAHKYKKKSHDHKIVLNNPLESVSSAPDSSLSTKRCYVSLERLNKDNNYSPLDSEMEQIKQIDCSNIKVPVVVKEEPISFQSNVDDYVTNRHVKVKKSGRTITKKLPKRLNKPFNIDSYPNGANKNGKMNKCKVILTKIDQRTARTLISCKQNSSTLCEGTLANPPINYHPFDPNLPSTSRGVHNSESGSYCLDDVNNRKCQNYPTRHQAVSSSTGMSYRRSGKHKSCNEQKTKNIKNQTKSQSISSNSDNQISRVKPPHLQERSNKCKINVSSDDVSLMLRNKTSYIDERFELNPQPVSDSIETACDMGPSCSSHSCFLKVKDEPLDERTEKAISECPKKKMTPKTQKKKAKLSRKKGSRHKFSNKKYQNKSKDSSKGSGRKYGSIPVVSLVSQGTQANSADIRRSVRRIRRVTARKAVASNSQSSFKSSKISARQIIKKAVDNRHPDTLDKATSTSDPLLEDDAVQVLKMTSGTLLSFTIIACGISDLIIENCPKLFHLEVQACRILKKLYFASCSDLQRFNVSQCPKLTIHQLANSVLSIHNPESYLLVSYEPCMQKYYPGEGEGAILSNLPKDETTAVICHDFQESSNESIQAKMKDKMMGWLQYLSTAYATLNYTLDNQSKNANYFPKKSLHYPFGHDIRRIHGEYMYSLKSEFCHAVGHYQLLSNNPLFSEAFETHNLDKEFPSFTDCEATKDNTLFSKEAKEQHLMMNGIVGFYIPITKYNRIETYKLPASE